MRHVKPKQVEHGTTPQGERETNLKINNNLKTKGHRYGHETGKICR